MRKQYRIFFLLLTLLAQASLAKTRFSDPAYKQHLKRSDVIWSLAFLSPEQILLTERKGKILRFDVTTQKVVEISGLPSLVAEGQGGLLDLILHPDFAKTKWIYFTLSGASAEATTTQLYRARLKDNQLTDVKKIFEAQPPLKSDLHYGSRLAFSVDGYILMTVGERNERDFAQRLDSHLGKVLRLKEDGSPAPGNPFEKEKGKLPEIWSYGHRNPQGIAINSKTGEVYINEHGPRGGDELNLIKPGQNYGWPTVTYGREYWGPKIGEGTSKSGIEEPQYHWTPSIAPSGLLIYSGKKFPEWKGSFFSGALALTHLNRLQLTSKKKFQEERFFTEKKWRIRSVCEGPSGSIWFTTDDGRLVELL